MDNAETIANLNRFEETIQQTMADMRESITREVVVQSEESISEQMPVLAGMIVSARPISTSTRTSSRWA